MALTWVLRLRPQHPSLAFTSEKNVPITLTFSTVGSQSAGATWTFTGFVSKFGASIPHDGLMTGDITIVMNGEPTWVAGV